MRRHQIKSPTASLSDGLRQLVAALERVGLRRQKGFWDHVADRAYDDDRVLKLVVERLVPKKHEVEIAADLAVSTERELERLRELRAQYHRELENHDLRNAIPVTASIVEVPPDVRQEADTAAQKAG